MVYNQRLSLKVTLRNWKGLGTLPIEISLLEINGHEHYIMQAFMHKIAIQTCHKHQIIHVSKGNKTLGFNKHNFIWAIKYTWSTP